MISVHIVPPSEMDPAEYEGMLQPGVQLDLRTVHWHDCSTVTHLRATIHQRHDVGAAASRDFFLVCYLTEVLSFGSGCDVALWYEDRLQRGCVPLRY